jgi:hypothetical protein
VVVGYRVGATPDSNAYCGHSGPLRTGEFVSAAVAAVQDCLSGNVELAQDSLVERGVGFDRVVLAAEQHGQRRRRTVRPDVGGVGCGVGQHHHGQSPVGELGEHGQHGGVPPQALSCPVLDQAPGAGQVGAGGSAQPRQAGGDVVDGAPQAEVPVAPGTRQGAAHRLGGYAERVGEFVRRVVAILLGGGVHERAE